MELTHAAAVARMKAIDTELERMQRESNPDESKLDALTAEFGELNEHRKQIERKRALDAEPFPTC
ncbi:hypothetical protein [Streptomyces synnematoformans]|uniref:Uncharacterized protein n=1 Tax=Streptomyces synnematoformans TaxID=415721 RepID=A0ABN2YWA4_9ACTN